MVRWRHAGSMWYFNHARPHQGLRQQIHDPAIEPGPTASAAMKIVAHPVLKGLHHHYRHAV
jgi:hypothetical protein